MPKLIVLAAFDRGEDGELFAVYSARKNSSTKSGPSGQRNHWHPITSASSPGAEKPIPPSVNMDRRPSCFRLAKYRTWKDKKRNKGGVYEATEHRIEC